MNVISWYANFETSDHFIMSTCSFFIVTAFAVPLSKLWHGLTWHPDSLLLEVAPLSLLFEVASLDLSIFVHPCRKDNRRLGNIVLRTQVRSE